MELERGGCSKQRPGLFTPEKEIRYPFYRLLRPHECLFTSVGYVCRLGITAEHFII